MTAVCRRSHTLLLVLAGVLLVGVAAYWPGLAGGFILDDAPNLSALGRQGGVHSLDRALAFVFGNHSGPAGRPLSMASFLLDAQDWPASAYPFKRTNLYLHLACGALLAFLVLGVLRQAGYGQRLSQGGALLCAALWIIHPLQASTVLYVIQRMTMLSTLFVLAGLLCYWHGRCGRARSGHMNVAWMVAGFGVGMGLGVLAKENAILMAAYVLVLEWVFASRLPSNRVLVLVARWGAIVPLLVTAAYLVHRVSGNMQAYDWRGWTWQERLLTQPRVLLDYLQQIVLPHVGRMGLSHDDWVVSRGLLKPVNTAWALLAVSALMAVAVVARHRAPLVALAIAWFFAGHLLESTALPLELYFEHRNYLPMAGIVLCVSVGLYQGAMMLASRGYRRLAWVPVAAPAIALFVLTYGVTTLWGNTLLLQASWAGAHPDSARAQKNLAQSLELAGDVDGAHQHMLQLFRERPDRLDAGINALILQCKYAIPAGVTTEDLLEKGRIESAPFDLYSALSSLLKQRLSTECDAVTLDDVGRLMLHVGQHERVGNNRLFMSRLFFDYADLKVAQRDFFGAIRALEASYRAKPSLDIALKLAVIWSTGQQYEQAYRWLMIARQHNEKRALFVPSREWELAILEANFSKHLHDAGVDIPVNVRLAEPPYVPEEE